MEINCRFGFASNKYECHIAEANITEKEHVIKEFKGAHHPGKTNYDVDHVWFQKTKVNHFPRGLQKHFPNISQLFIIGGGIKEISKHDLRGLEKLNYLNIQFCELTTLPDDLFTAMPNLRTLTIYECKVEFASSKLLKPLLGRENVAIDLRRNINIDAGYWPRNYPSSLKSLEDLMKLIDEKCKKPIDVPEPVYSDPRLKKMWISGKFSDLTIVAGDKEFKVHKNVLGTDNEVFAQIFEDQPEAMEMKIDDFSADSVEALLKFIYTNEASKDGNAKENFDIADKFKVEAMKTFYEKIICDQIDEENALETFLFAHRLASQLIKEKAFRQIAIKIPDLPKKLMEDPENLKKLIDARKVYEEILQNQKN